MIWIGTNMCMRAGVVRRSVVTIFAGFAAVPALAYSPDDLVSAEITMTVDTGFGSSAFVSGNVPELGASILTAAPKLTWNTGNIWRAKIGLPPATTFNYQLYKRTDGPTTIGNSGNGTTLAASVTTTTAANPNLTLPASKTLNYRSGWTQVTLQVETPSGSNTFVNFPMTDIGPGRSVGERLWRVSGFGIPGRSVRYKLTNGTLTDQSPYGGLYETYLDAALLQDGQVFNYVPAATVSVSRIEVLAAIPSPQGLQSRPVRVYLPRGYNEHLTRRYPVLYMHDGQNIYGLTGSSFPTTHWNVDGTFNKLTGMGQAREVIVVGIDNTSARNSELTPPNAPSGGLSGGTGEKYAAYVRDTIKPLIDAAYRTLPDRANTGVAGSSLGGLISTYIALEQPATWSKVGALSPAYWANLTATSGRFATEPTLPTWRHFFSCGTTGDSSSDGFTNCIDARDALLRRGQVYNVDVLNEIGFGESHNEQAWQNRFPTTARFLFPIEDETTDLGSLAGSSVRDFAKY